MKTLKQFITEANEHEAPEEMATVYHLTDKANFKPNPKYAPTDNSISIEDRSGLKGLYVTHDVEHWVNGYGYARPFVAEITVPKKHLVQGRWGGERFIPAEHFDKAQVNRVIPLDAHAREKFGDHGWIESAHGHTFDTGEKIKPNNSNVPPLRGYKYDGDVRTASPDEIKRLKSHFATGNKNRLKYR
jgi:hypothetical protein